MGGRFVGAVWARACDSVLHVGRLVVAPDWQRRGVGSQLLAAVEADRPPGVTSATLFTRHLSEGNLRLYFRHGYVEQRREAVRPGLVLIHLVKPLGTSSGERVGPSFEDQLRVLEESLWRGETRFDHAYMEIVLADDFAEVGRSGRAWTRGQILDVPAVDVCVELPLPGFTVRLLAPGVALATYRSVVRIAGEDRADVTHRSSAWVHDGDHWRLVFHQGTSAAHPAP